MSKNNLPDEGIKHKVKYFDPPNILRQKCGMGGLSPQVLSRAENLIDENELDFTPYTIDIMAELDKAIAEAKKAEKADKSHIEEIVAYIMELKANGGMFQYILITEIASVILNFLEGLDELNDDAFDIIEVHQRALRVITKHKLRGTGGKEGKALSTELFDACNRYRKKYTVFIDVT